MRLNITERDNAMLRHVEEYGSITIKECEKLFYNEQGYGYDLARKRLNKLVKYGKLNTDRDYFSNQNVYYMDKKLSFHDLLIMDYYAELIRCGADIVYFQQEQKWSVLESDAFCCYWMNNTLFFNLIEVVKTTKVNFSRYKKLYDTGEVQNVCNDIAKKIGGEEINLFPRVIIIDNTKRKEPMFINDKVKVFQLDYSLNNFATIFF